MPASGAQTGAPDDEAAARDPDLARLVELWPTLTAATRRKIAALIGVTM